METMITELTVTVLAPVLRLVGEAFHIEVVRLSGIRKEPLASWTKDAEDRAVPELALNLGVMQEAFLQLLATVLGAFILVSATTVLLGGFSTEIRKTNDFWYITAIGIVQSARVVGSMSEPKARFFMQFPTAYMHMVNWSILLLPLLFAAVPILAALACFTLSIFGLSGVHNYGHFDTDPNRGNVKPALIVFYSIALSQGAVFFVWFFLWIGRSRASLRLRNEYFGIGNKTGRELVDRYVTQTQDELIEKGVFSTTNRTLVSFAAELLQSEYRSDHVSAVSVLHVLIRRKERAAGAVEQICSSEEVVSSLFKLLRSNSPLDPVTKAYTAEIVAKLACNLRLTDIPGAAHSISSLLDPHPRLMKTAAQDDPEPPAPGETQINTTNRNARPLITNEGRAEPSQLRETQTQTQTTDANQGGAKPSQLRETQTQTNNTDGGGSRDKPLIVHGLLILCELASDPGNCTEICNTTHLVPKIIAPVRHGMLMSIGNDPKTVQIIKASLRVLSKLTRGRGESSRKTRRELSDIGKTAQNILWIARNSSDQEMRMLAVEILTRLIFDSQDSPPRSSAGQALDAIAMNRGNCEITWEQLGDDFPSLVKLMNDVAYSTEQRAVTAELLAHICAKSRTDQATTSNHNSSVSNALSTVLEAVVTAEITDMTERRKFLASFLGLAVQIRENIVCRRLIKFPEKLKDIIVEMATESEDEICMVITKAATKLVTWTMRIDPVYALYFQQQDIVGKLDGIVNVMGDLERCFVLSGGADEIEGYDTLQTLVEKVRDLIPIPPQH